MTGFNSVSVILPTYNEADNLPSMLETLLALPLPRLHIFIVDDSSPDGTGAIADSWSQKSPASVSVVHRKGRLGLGTAYLEGFQSALARGSEAVVQMDCDFSHNPAELPPMLKKLETCDVVVGSRYIPGGRLDDRWELGRRFLSRWGSFYSHALLGLRVNDATAGFKIWRRETLEGIGFDRVRSNGYVFQVEMAYLSQRLGYRVIEHPILFEDRRIGRSKMNMTIKLEAAWRVWQVWWLHHRLQPKDRAMKSS